MSKIRTNRGEVFDTDGKSILETLQNRGVYIPASCGGKGSCGRCKIKLIEGGVITNSYSGLSKEEINEGYVLACQSYPEGDILIELPEKLITVSDRISQSKIEIIKNTFEQNPQLLNPLVRRISLSLNPPTIEDSQADFERIKIAVGRNLNISRKNAEILPDLIRRRNWTLDLAVTDDELISFIETNQRLYAVTVDLGTTTIVLALVDLEKGGIVDVVSCYNSQISFGDDVITRIVYSIEKPKGVEILRKSIVDDVNSLLNAITTRHDDGKISYVVLSGNTTMCHLFWGLNPKYIREEPYTPVINHYPVWRASDGRLNLDGNIPIYTVPSVAGFVGGDIVSGVLASGIYRESEVCLFIDVGTNGEIVIGNKDWLLTASTSAGPCFEGSGISCGMRATEGAIESFKYDAENQTYELKIIGQSNPRGICGSGMIDIVSELFNAGIIDNRGKLIMNSSKFLSNVGGELRFYLSENCYISQADIDNIIRAKAAIYAGISTLINEIGISESDIKKVFIAGGFGEFLDVKKAISIGMLPNLPLERFIFLGNTSLSGAILSVLSKELKDTIEEIADKMTYTDLSRSRIFMDEYVSALFLPHTDINRFKNLKL